MLSSICFMPASLMPQSLPPLVPSMSRYFCDSTVVMCMRAGLYQQKKGLLVFFGVVAIEEVNRRARRFPRPPFSSARA